MWWIACTIRNSKRTKIQIESTGSKVLFSDKRLGLRNTRAVFVSRVVRKSDNLVFRRFQMSSEVFWRLQESLNMFVPSSKNPSLLGWKSHAYMLLQWWCTPGYEKNSATIKEKLNFYVYMYYVEQVTESVST